MLNIDFIPQDAKRKLRRYRERLGNMRPVFADLGKYITRDIKRRHTREEDFQGRRLIPSKAALTGISRKTLWRTGKLRRSWSFTATNDSLEVEPRGAEYYPYLHFGTRRLPPRRMIGFSEKLKRRITRNVIKHLRS